jgi:hypothetical protein
VLGASNTLDLACKIASGVVLGCRSSSREIRNLKCLFDLAMTHLVLEYATSMFFSESLKSGTIRIPLALSSGSDRAWCLHNLSSVCVNLFRDNYE